MKMKILASIGIFSSIALLTGCGLWNTDKEPSTISGTVVDGYLSNAKVCYKNTTICTTTDNNGKFTLERIDLPLEVISDANTINSQTSANYTSVLEAPIGYNVVTPLTTVLMNQNIDNLAKVINVDVNALKEIIKKDPIVLAETNTTAAEIYAKGAMLDKIVSSIMADSNTSDITKKEKAIQSLFNIALDNNKTLVSLTENDFKTIYQGYKSLVNEQISDINATKISQIATTLSALMDQNITSLDQAIELEKSLSGRTIDTLMQDDNLSISLDKLQADIKAQINPIDIPTIQTSKTYDVLAGDVVKEPEVSSIVYKYAKNIADTNYTITLTQGEDFNLSNADQFSVKLDNNNFVTFDDSSLQQFNKEGNITLKVKSDGLINPVEYTVLYITPKNNDGEIGETKKVLIVVNKPTLERKTINYPSEFTSSIIIDASNNNYQLTQDQLTTDVKLSDTNTRFIFVDSNDTKVVSADVNDTDVLMHNLTNGTAKITIVTLDNDYNIEFNTTTVEIKNVDSPPVLKINDYPAQAVSNDDYVDVNISYSMIDIDNYNNGYSVSVSGCENNPTLNSIEGNITCQLAVDGNTHKITLQGSDGYLNSVPTNIYIQTLQGNVAPTLTLFANAAIDVDTMTSQTFNFIANDLNGYDTFEINATSSDESIVKVSVDKNNSTLTIYAQPKVGTATVSVWAEDNTGLKSQVYTLEILTHNTLGELVPTLYLIPPMDKDGNLLDNRYKLTNFNIDYDIVNNSVLLYGDINATKDENVTLNQFVLKAYPDEALYAGEDRLENNDHYGFVFSNGFSYEGQFDNGRVLVFTEGNDTVVNPPYYWALATRDEVCNAYKDNNTSFNNIKAVNEKLITCE